MRIAVIAGIPIRLHVSFLALIGAFLVWAAVTKGMIGLLLTAAVSLGLFGSVVLHELGHAMAARRYGIGTAHITLYPFGGIAAIEDMPEEPVEELVIALAGPAVNFALAALFAWAFALTGWPIAGILIAMNLVMGLFNLIPAFPMDGGRVLRALLATRMGWVPASHLSIKVGRAFAWIFLVGGIAFSHLGLVLVGAFLHVALNAEKQRLVHMVWERQRYGQTDWRNPKPWGGRGGDTTPKVYVPRWSVRPR